MKKDTHYSAVTPFGELKIYKKVDIGVGEVDPKDEFNVLRYL